MSGRDERECDRKRTSNIFCCCCSCCYCIQLNIFQRRMYSIALKARPIVVSTSLNFHISVSFFLFHTHSHSYLICVHLQTPLIAKHLRIHMHQTNERTKSSKKKKKKKKNTSSSSSQQHATTIHTNLANKLRYGEKEEEIFRGERKCAYIHIYSID